MKKLVLSVLVLFAVSALMPALAQTKEKKEIKTTASKYEKTRGADENIKTAKPTDDQKATEKEKTRGELCYININNYTPYAIDIYVDGEWVGTIAAYATAYTYSYPGDTKLYGKSVGGTYYWGPQYFTCSVEYTWNLWE